MKNLEFDHIALQCDNIAETIAFYKKTFDSVEILYQDASWAFLNVCGVKLALVLPTEHPPHICFKVESHDELEHLAAEYKKKIKVHRDKSESFYITDPNSNAIEFAWLPGS